MRIHTELVYIWDEAAEAHILVSERGFDFPDNGKLDLCKGASAAQNSLAASQTNFYNQLSGDYSQQFANQNNILNTLQNTFNPTVAAGPNQYGFNAAETNNLNSSVINNTATQYANASRALGQQQGAQGGGNTLLPSGVASGQQAALAAGAANQTATGLTGVQQAGYQQGLNNYNNATGALSGVAGQYGSSANSTAGSANNAGSAAGSEINTITQENNAASPWNLVSGILGGAASAGLGVLTGGMSTALGGATGVGTALEGIGGSGGPLSTTSSDESGMFL